MVDPMARRPPSSRERGWCPNIRLAQPTLHDCPRHCRSHPKCCRPCRQTRGPTGAWLPGC
eukprot:3721815-Pyramimonas_sp.AAC.1